MKKDIEGDWVLGWPDRKGLLAEYQKDTEGRVIGARSPVLDLEGLITPTDATYIVAQLQVPDPMHPDDYALEVSGEVENPYTLSLEGIRRFPARVVRAVVECAGNDHDFFDYLQAEGEMEKPSLAVARGATMAKLEYSADPGTCYVSGGEWMGVSLADVLNRAGVKSSAVAVRLEGWDRGRPDPSMVYGSVGRDDFEVPDPGVINYDKGLPIEKAMDPDSILAWAHNGDALRHVHGAPLRLIVPGWAGNWWVKWIQKIDVMDRMPDCYHQTEYFVFGKSPDDPNKRMMTALGVKTLILEPRDEHSPLSPGSHAVRGLAWSGEGAIVRVEISVDGGKTRCDAQVEQSPDKWLWKRWFYLWRVDEPCQYRIMARATDELGRVQPQTEWNYQRKHFDGIVPVDVTVE